LAASDFFRPEARTKVAEAVQAVEKRSSAEIVVAVRRRSGHYRHTDLYVGAAFAMAMLLFLLFDWHVYALEWIPVNVAIAFLLGVLFSTSAPILRRALTARSVLRENVSRGARAAFYDMGVSRTRGRTGVLVFVSMLERRVEVVPDIAVAVDRMGRDWQTAVRALEQSVARRPDLGRFLVALRGLGDPLAAVLPVQDDDINELPDEPEVA
jgi:putative membrane protein